MPPLEESGGVRQHRIIAGEGMLVAELDGDYRDAYGTHRIRAGVTRVRPDHPLARARPDAFRVAWKEDAIVMRQHRNNLLARMKELRGEAPAKVDTPVHTERPSWWI
jgi:hypothetical protein